MWCSEFKSNDASKCAFLPRAGHHDKVILQGQVTLGGDEVMRKLAASAWKFEHLLVGLHDMQVGSRHLGWEPEKAGLLGDIVCTGTAQRKRGDKL